MVRTTIFRQICQSHAMSIAIGATMRRSVVCGGCNERITCGFRLRNGRHHHRVGRHWQDIFTCRGGPHAERLGMRGRDYRSQRGHNKGWQDDVRRIVDIARLNGISAEDLARSAERSITSLTVLLPVAGVGETSDVLDMKLREAVLSCAA